MRSDKKSETAVPEKEVRRDGYKNLLSKYGTEDDVSENYRFESGEPVTDIELTINYEENGLFSKIIDIPSDDAVSSGFSYGLSDLDIEKYINDSLDNLDFEEKASTAIKWSRLYGGALMVMVIDDGKGLEDPVDWDSIRGIDELLVFERPLVNPDYNNIYQRKIGEKHSKFGMPEFYDISPIYGSPFRVHESRCLLFKNGILPSMSTRTEYRFFGMPEYMKIHKDLQRTVTSHGNGVKMLDRAVQAIYKMKDLADLLSTDEGTEQVLERLRLIDMAKGIINSIAIDADGEEYDFKNITFTGVKDIIDATCNMLSAITEIPQTKLFGRSPAGENATGEGDMENYYKFVNKIQKLNLKNNLGTLIDIILIVGKAAGEFDEIPDYVLEFNPLWSLSETEQANVDKTKADTELVKAQTAQAYVDMQALDASEIRKRLAESGEFTINDVLDEDDGDWNEIEEQTPAVSEQPQDNTELPAQEQPAEQTDSQSEPITPTGCGVIVVQDGRILIGTRKDNGLICGPGGHIEPGEKAIEAAVRETREEFGINIDAEKLIPIGVVTDTSGQYCPSEIFLCTEFFGIPICFNAEMEEARFETMANIHKQNLFLPFELSLRKLSYALQAINTDAKSKGKDVEFRMINGRPVPIGENGEPMFGGLKDKGEEKNTSKENNKPKKQIKNSEKEKKSLNESSNRGIIYAEETISSYIGEPKKLGQTTHKEKYDDFVEHGVEVKPLAKGSLKGKPYEDGGGYKVNGEQDGKYMQYHPESESHHGGEYYKVSSGKTGTKRYDMDGNEI